ncbi:unnamed protein product [Nippostrongylus brasiliensis]|uniref:Transmembrane protein 52 n=1 Tax=Nippostrongylus brasiliensis TaxID=27835 RepID=A0A0N4YNX0_NIPBR|nr:unnamed protein product [Nippostrongylus brasiliensis]
MLLRHRLHGPMEDVAITDPFFWRKVSSPSARASPHGEVVAYTPDAFEPQQLLSASWLIYSLILTTALCLLLTVCLVLYCCLLRRKSRRGSQASDRDRILRDSPDYSVKMRSTRTVILTLLLAAPSQPPSTPNKPCVNSVWHLPRMVSILVPGVDQPGEAIVKRVPTPEKVHTPPLLAPSPAPLVNVDEQ